MQLISFQIDKDDNDAINGQKAASEHDGGAVELVDL